MLSMTTLPFACELLIRTVNTNILCIFYPNSSVFTKLQCHDSQVTNVQPPYELSLTMTLL